LQPDGDRLATPGGVPVDAGWQAVRKFLGTSDAALVIGTFDLVVVHVDADIETIVAAKLEAEPDDEPGGLDPLCRHVKGWLGREVPANAVVVLPRRNIDAWLVAVHTNYKDVEAITDPAEVLATRDLLLRRGGVVQKKRAAYARLAQPLPALMDQAQRIQRVPELARFVGKVAARQREVLRAARGL
jgi:hypothetical protein